MPHTHAFSLKPLREALIDAQSSHAAFEAALQSIAEAFNAHSVLAYVPSHDPSHGYAVDMIGWGTQEVHEEGQAFTAACGELDPWRIGGAKRGMLDHRVCAIGEQLADDAIFRASPWGDFFRAREIDHMLGDSAPAGAGGAPHIVVSLYRGRNQGAFGAANIAHLEALGSSLESAAEQRFSVAPGAAHADAALIALTEPAFIIGRGGLMTWCNGAGDAVLAQGGPLRLQSNALVAVAHHRAEPVRAAIAQALRGRGAFSPNWACAKPARRWP
jgi:hypothetical protein